MTYAVIPSSVVSIGGGAFARTSLYDIYYTGSESEWNDIIIGEYWDYWTPEAIIHYNYILGSHMHTYIDITDLREPTCSDPGERLFVCDCGYSCKKEIGVDSSNHVNTENRAAVAATCITSGYTAGVYCNDCKRWISGHNYISINKNSHLNTVSNAAIPSTCVKTGFTAGVFCNDCKTWISGHEETAVDHSNHVNTKTVAAVASTCTARGYSAGVYCNDCKKFISGHAEQSLAAHQTTIINAKAATYDTEGYTGDTYCTVCKQTISYGSSISKLIKPEESTSSTQSTNDDSESDKNLNFFQRIIQWIRDFFARLFGRI